MKINPYRTFYRNLLSKNYLQKLEPSLDSQTFLPVGDILDLPPHRDMPLCAQLGKLRYVNDTQPGFSRKRHGEKFRYLDVDGKPLKNPAHLARIKSLAIPPAWKDVWICKYAHGHLQATGRDAKGRKQYRYHQQWREVRDEMKYDHLADFGMQLPMIRQVIDQELAKPGITRTKVLATIVYLLENTMIRIGNDAYAKQNKSFGLTTLRNRHVNIDGSQIEFHFRGKSGIDHQIRLKDSRLARIVKRIKDLPGQELFQYVDGDGSRHAVDSSEVNDYLKEITGKDYTAKDFRTWSGTVQATLLLQSLQPFTTVTEAKKNISLAIETAAKRLGNTPAICRKCYVHPLIIEKYLAGEMQDLINQTPDEDQQLTFVEHYILETLQGKEDGQIRQPDN